MTNITHEDLNAHANLLARSIDDSYDLMVAATLLTGTPGAPGMYADDEAMERAADTTVRLRAKLRAAAAQR